jgi:hypothetical protein
VAWGWVAESPIDMSLRSFALANARPVPPPAGYLKRHQVTKCWLLVGLLLRRSTLTPTTLRGPALNGHPCPSSAPAASMPLGPLRAACVQPAPKSRFVVFELSRTRATLAGASALRFVGSCINRPHATLNCRSVACPAICRGPAANPVHAGVRQNRVAGFCYRCAVDRGQARSASGQNQKQTGHSQCLLRDRSHAPRGNACQDAPRPR